MVQGKLACIGDSLHLKSLYGGGYRLSLTVPPERTDAVIARVRELVPGTEVTDSSAGSLALSLPPESTANLPPLLRWIEKHTLAPERPEGIIEDWGVTQTSLEEVFLALTNQFETGEG